MLADSGSAERLCRLTLCRPLVQINIRFRLEADLTWMQFFVDHQLIKSYVLRTEALGNI